MRCKDQSGVVCPKFIPLPQTLGSTSHLGMSALTHQLGMFSYTLTPTCAYTRLYGTYQYNIGMSSQASVQLAQQLAF